MSQRTGEGHDIATLDDRHGRRRERTLLGWIWLFLLLTLAGAVFGYLFGSMVS